MRNEIAGRYITNRGNGVTHVMFWWRNLSGGGHLEVLGIDGKIIGRRLIKK
jgi:hypothetical protein